MDNLTYTEAHCEDPFDWAEELKALIKQRALAREQGFNLRRPDTIIEKASSWVTCACGNQCNVIPRHNGGKPKDFVLGSLGTEFFQAICKYDFEWALEILGHIEKRSSYLIAEINNKTPL